MAAQSSLYARIIVIHSLHTVKYINIDTMAVVLRVAREGAAIVHSSLPFVTAIGSYTGTCRVLHSAGVIGVADGYTSASQPPPRGPPSFFRNDPHLPAGSDRL